MTPHKPTGGESAITRKSLAAEWDREDAIVEAANRQKRDGANRYRAQLAAKGWSKEDIKAELEGFRKAFARRRAIATKGLDTVEALDAIAEEILVEISGSHAPRATRVENIEEFDPETGEIIEPNSNTAPASQVVAVLSGGEGTDPALSADTESTAARKDVPRQEKVGGGRGIAAHVDLETAQAGTQAPPVDINSEPEGASIGEMPSMASEPATEGGAASPQPPSVVPGRQPGCLNPDTCAGTWRKRCASCERAFMAVAAGGQVIVHQGQVA
jgi:hypothetical protein